MMNPSLVRVTRAFHVAAVLLLPLAACDSTTGPDLQLQVGGDYSVLKTITSDTCLGTIGSPLTTPSSVTHTAGAAGFILVDHGTRSLPGQVSRDGTMTMANVQSTVMGTIAATDAFTGGRFSTTGFQLTVTTDLSDNPYRPGTGAGPCRVIATWAGTRTSGANVIPGGG